MAEVLVMTSQLNDVRFKRDHNRGFAETVLVVR